MSVESRLAIATIGFRGGVSGGGGVVYIQGGIDTSIDIEQSQELQLSQAAASTLKDVNVLEITLDKQEILLDIDTDDSDISVDL